MTPSQNKALHSYFRRLAETLNDEGHDVAQVLSMKTVSVAWTEEAVKELLFRPIARALSGSESTTGLDSQQLEAAFDTLNKHLGENLGLTYVPFSVDDK